MTTVWLKLQQCKSIVALPEIYKSFTILHRHYSDHCMKMNANCQKYINHWGFCTLSGQGQSLWTKIRPQERPQGGVNAELVGAAPIQVRPVRLLEELGTPGTPKAGP